MKNKILTNDNKKKIKLDIENKKHFTQMKPHILEQKTYVDKDTKQNKNDICLLKVGKSPRFECR